jgi:hypothetical protein
LTAAALDRHRQLSLDHGRWPVLVQPVFSDSGDAQYTPTDGTLAANTCKDGLLGNMYRAKFTSTGTYAGNTSVRIDLVTDGLTAYP